MRNMLPAQSPSLLCGTFHKTLQGACAGKAGTEGVETMPSQGTGCTQAREKRVNRRFLFVSLLNIACGAFERLWRSVAQERSGV